MNSLTPWFESFIVFAIALFAFMLGSWFSRLPKPYWALGYFIPLGLVLLYVLALFDPRLALAPPLSWMLIGRIRFAFFNFITTVMLSVPLSRLPQKRNRIVVRALICVLTAASILPFLAPAFNRSYLAGLKTRLDPDGVCRQSNDYTCGPAAAVTALRKLGLPAEEGELAILAHTSSLAGTEPDVLAKVLQNLDRTNGLVAEYRSFRDVDDLKQAGLTVAVLRFNALQNHCVTILGVQTNCVLVGDPLNGLTLMPTDEFENKWLFVGIVLKLTPAAHTN
jgi:predicted double-glycine peptidase